MIYEVNGNLLESNVDIICHQVNCQGAMRSGIAKSIREKWPAVYKSYKDIFNLYGRNDWNLLGECDFVEHGCDGHCVVNMFSQEYFGYDGKRYTSYDAFWNCLHQIRIHAEHCEVKPTIGFPARIGCVRGGANWEVIKTMISEVLKDFDVYIYNLEA